MLSVNAAALLLATSSAVSLFVTARIVQVPLGPRVVQQHHDVEHSCNVKAWVRAEDLLPSSILNGDLRVKVNPSCTEEVKSVGLQLQLDEFSAVKYPRKGVSLPKPPVRGNSSSQPESFYLHRYGLSDDENNRYREALREPELWELRAEERTAWKSAVNLLEGPFDYARPLVVPFVVAMPHVQFPPGQESYPMFPNFEDLEFVTDYRHSYHYTALITFSDGRTVEVPAGFTTFHPAPTVPSAQVISTNITFSSTSCYDQNMWLGTCSSLIPNETAFTAHIDFEHGNAVHAGSALKGRITLNSPADGTSSIDSMATFVHADRNQHWAQTQAVSGGNSDAFHPDSCSVRQLQDSEISVSSCQYGYIFQDENACNNNNSDIRLPFKATNFADFEIVIGKDTIQDFQMHYADLQSFLNVQLNVAYPPEVQRCLRESNGDEDASPNASDADMIEEGLWEAYIPVGEPRIPYYPATYAVSATIPITILSAKKYAISPPSEPPVHYLSPDGVPSPVLFAVAPASINEVVFPMSQPVISVEPINNTIERMLSSCNSYNLYAGEERPDIDPTRDYYSGAYAGLLWKKKYMAGIMTYPPVIAGSEEAEGLKKFKGFIADNMGYMPAQQAMPAW